MALLHDDADGLRFDFDETETGVLRDLLGHVDTLLAGDTLPAAPSLPGATPAPDPALARLLPPAHRDDPRIAGSYRELTEEALREDKRADIGVVVAGLPLGAGTAVLEDPDAWLRALNDLRLTLGVELDITEDSAPPRRVRTQRDLRLTIYFWLTHLQESLVQTLLAGGGGSADAHRG
ncbi:MAG: DUF2017 family protein [Geodermatophilaceae bacterium]|nr:DUF2017 family protein [Geodermatophilaceae bacterium]